MRYVWSHGDVVMAGDQSRHQEEIGEVRRSSLWANRPELTTTVDLPPEDAVFALWLAHLITVRDRSAASSPMT